MVCCSVGSLLSSLTDPLVACVHLFYRFSHGQRLYRRGAFVASEGVDGQVSDEDEGQRRYRHVQVGMELP